MLALTLRLATEFLWVAAVLPVVVWVGVGLVLLIWYLWRARSADYRRWALHQAAVIVAVLALIVPVAALGNRLTERTRFMLERPEYDRIVASVTAGTERSPTMSARQYIVDSGPPIRVAFIWPGGIVDNWCGIVHDSSGEVMKVNDLDRFSDSWRSSPITGLFGGDMISCRAVDDAYFLCCFT